MEIPLEIMKRLSFVRELAVVLAALLMSCGWADYCVGGQVSTGQKDVTITPHTPYADFAFEELERRGGPRVEKLCYRVSFLRVPVGMRFKAVKGRKLIEAIAREQGLEVVWLQGGRTAVIQSGVTDGKFNGILKEMQSEDPKLRMRGAWRAGWIWDVRIFLPLVKAAGDPETEVSHQAMKSAQKLGLSVGAASVGEGFLPLLEKALAGNDPFLRENAATALGKIGGKKALALLEKALADKESSVRAKAAWALGSIGGEKALALLEKALTDKDKFVRNNATSDPQKARSRVTEETTVIRASPEFT
ncbi:MAG: HEAT repeat domain-containing protein, partial [Deltaproteobacteria bacterium]|nr:HEAT repeat domain-containing protein [Deltaproteobacteria bacterium]